MSLSRPRTIAIPSVKNTGGPPLCRPPEAAAGAPSSSLPRRISGPYPTQTICRFGSCLRGKTAKQHGMAISGMRKGAPIPFFIGQRDPPELTAPRAVIPCGFASGAAFFACPPGCLGAAIPSVKALFRLRAPPLKPAPLARLHRRSGGLAGGALSAHFSPPKTFPEGGGRLRVASTPAWSQNVQNSLDIRKFRADMSKSPQTFDKNATSGTQNNRISLDIR